MSLGESRSFALKRYYQNKRSLTRKGQLTSFHKRLDEYHVLGHAELVPASEFSSPSSQVYYLPTHEVVKESSTTTKLRIVFDGSAKSSNNLSLNDILCPGPSLYPLITTVFNCFRLHVIGMSADISKMFREVGLASSDRDLHRFFHEDSSGNLEEWRMCRVTFGITCSPFLPSKVLLQIAEDYSMEFPEATAVIRNAFYVDDCLTGAGTLKEADKLRQDLNSLLSHRCFTLRKWCSSSAELLEQISAELKEADGSDLAVSSSQCPKTLGVHCNTHSDMLYVCIPDLTHLQIPTKREASSAVGKFFDVLG